LNLDLEIKDTTDTDRSASYLDLHLGIDSEGQLITNLEDKRDYLNFHIVNYPLMSIKNSSILMISVSENFWFI
jgi:hypothetical protein